MDDQNILAHSVIIRSQTGWRLNKVPEVRDFIHGALFDFERAEFEKVKNSDMPPTAFFYNKEGQLLSEVLIEKFHRKELFELFEIKGIQKKNGFKIEKVVKEEFWLCDKWDYEEMLAKIFNILDESF